MARKTEEFIDSIRDDIAQETVTGGATTIIAGWQVEASEARPNEDCEYSIAFSRNAELDAEGAVLFCVDGLGEVPIFPGHLPVMIRLHVKREQLQELHDDLGECLDELRALEGDALTQLARATGYLGLDASQDDAR